MRRDRLARLHRAVDREAAERVQVVPYAEGEYLAGAPDPKRPAKEIDAVVTEIPKGIRTHGNATNSGHNVELRSALHSVKYTTAALPYPLREGDRIVLLEGGNRELKVNSTEPFGTGRTIARLEPLKAATTPSP